MDDLASITAGLPVVSIDAGTPILEEGATTGRLYVLIDGMLEVRKGDVVVARVRDPGSFFGEMAALLGAPHSATVSAGTDAHVAVIEDAAAEIGGRPDLALAIARLLARRLHAVTAYLADLKRQYAGTGSHLELMDQVLAELITIGPTSAEPGSERDDVPDY